VPAIAGAPAQWRLKQNEPHKQDESQNKANNDDCAGGIEFSLEFVVNGSNSVQQMINGAALQIPKCHGHDFRAVLVPVASGCEMPKKQPILL
jgi:hypothetical protein